MSSERSIGVAYATALAAKDYEQLQQLFAPDIDFRSLTPNRVWEASDSDTLIREILQQWFEEQRRDQEPQAVRRTSSETVKRSDTIRRAKPEGDFLVEQAGLFFQSRREDRVDARDVLRLSPRRVGRATRGHHGRITRRASPRALVYRARTSGLGSGRTTREPSAAPPRGRGGRRRVFPTPSAPSTATSRRPGRTLATASAASTIEGWSLPGGAMILLWASAGAGTAPIGRPAFSGRSATPVRRRGVRPRLGPRRYP